MSVRALSKAISYLKAVLLSDGIILGKNEKDLPCERDSILVKQTSQTQKAERNKLYKSNTSYEGLVDGTKIFG